MTGLELGLIVTVSILAIYAVIATVFWSTANKPKTKPKKTKLSKLKTETKPNAKIAEFTEFTKKDIALCSKRSSAAAVIAAPAAVIAAPAAGSDENTIVHPPEEIFMGTFQGDMKPK